MDEYISQAVSLPPDGQLHILVGIALILGLGKGGVPGLATVATAATVLTAPSDISGGLGYAVALQVPILSMIDVYAAWLHSTALDWPTVWLLLPTTFLGMGIGQLIDRRMSDRGARLMVGCILLGILALRTWKDVVSAICPSWALQQESTTERKERKVAEGKGSDDESDIDSTIEKEAFLDNGEMEALDIEQGDKQSNQEHAEAQQQRKPSPSSSRASTFGWACVVGLIGGAATMLTNSMGPILNVYLLSVRELSPQAYIGTRAMFFCFINLGKLPMRFIGGTLGWPMIPAAAGLGLVSILGVFLAKPIMMGMKESTFVTLELAVVAFAGLRMCYMGLN
mmetsp:Transcript_17938/g.38910  ORF Transcript_17938/g.38910 Transcript_17938/m.38910 type:complete len:339 (+) Transcript_17938:90-1106(+)